MESNKCLECFKDIKNYKFKFCFVCSQKRKKQYDLEHPHKCECGKSIKQDYKFCYDCNTKQPKEVKKSCVEDYL